MGTRNLVAVHLDGQYRIAQYGQWDGYPDGQGATVLEFLARWGGAPESSERRRFEANLRQCSWMGKADYDAIKNDPDLNANWAFRLPHLSRGAGAKVLAMVQEKPLKLKNSIDFAGDSLMCEWAYVIDLDKNTLEVFTGFNTEPLMNGDRFYDFPKTDSGYQQVRLGKAYSLGALPDLARLVADFTMPAEEAEPEVTVTGSPAD